MSGKLALNGGPPVRSRPFPVYRTIGSEEMAAVRRVVKSGVLSRYLGTWSPEFYGGPEVLALEREWSAFFKVRHAVTVNSATSGLYAAIGAAGVGPGDEVVVSPYTMTASATCALTFNAVPVFADIDPHTYCITAETIRRVLTPRTRAIVVVDLFGHPADMRSIMALAVERNITVIEDAAQAPGARYGRHFAGTLGHMGVFSLNYHKTIHTGEGGVVVTNRAGFAERLQLIRNHAEVVVDKKGTSNLVNMIGFNFRMTEIEAAIGREQLMKLPRLVPPRQHAAAYLTKRLSNLPGITPPVVMPEVEHGYYVYAMRYDAVSAGCSRERFVKAVRAEGIPMGAGYVRPIYLEPMYQRRTAYGKQGCPFCCPLYTGRAEYPRGLCPVAERMYFHELVTMPVCHAGVREKDLADVVKAIRKVLAYIRKG